MEADRRQSVAALLLLAVIASALVGQSCGEEIPGPQAARSPIILVGIDGMEWRVVLELIGEGKLPTVARLMEHGTYGRISTLTPTLSPVIWTSIATGKYPDKHGIKHFAVVEKKDRRVRINTNSDRRTKALWNILSDYGQRVHSIGWWMTFPAEEINGVMVAQTNTAAQIDTSGGKAVQKGSVIRGVEGQVTPREYQDRVMEVAGAVDNGLLRLTEEIFGRFPYPHTEFGGPLWRNTLWAFRADSIYDQVARETVSASGPFDLLMLYFGGTDVVGHRFWRFRYPGEFTFPPLEKELENYGNIIGDYYTSIDSALEKLLASLPLDTTVVLVSDHGMVTDNSQEEFHPGQPPEQFNSGNHQNGPAGIFIASGRHIRSGGQLGGKGKKELPVIGTIMDIAPTILALRNLPIGRDMDGEVLTTVLEEGFTERHPLHYVESHDTAEWLAARPSLPVAPQVERERLDQLRSLGYIK